MKVGFDQPGQDGSSLGIDAGSSWSNPWHLSRRAHIRNHAILDKQRAIAHRWSSCSINDLAIGDDQGALSEFHGNCSDFGRRESATSIHYDNIFMTTSL